MPPADKLAAFVRAAGTLNVEVVGGVVLDLLGEESWQVCVYVHLYVGVCCALHMRWVGPKQVTTPTTPTNTQTQKQSGPRQGPLRRGGAGQARGCL